jgi:Tol biopolymer transport system component/DNA-binding winged helix-turn-helix (wHTH) protein
MKPENKELYEFGVFRLDSVERVLWRDGDAVPLTQKVFDLLLLLVENRGQVVEKDRLMNEIWPNTFVEEGNLTQNISVLRKILDADGHQYIQTVPRRGYRFVGHVNTAVHDGDVLVEEHSVARVIIEESSSADAATERQSIIEVLPSAVPIRFNRALSQGKGLAAIALGLVITVGLGWLFFRPRKVESRNPPPFDISNVILRKLTNNGNIVYGVISADGQFVAYSSVDDDNRYSIWFQHAGSNEPIQLIPPQNEPVGPVAISHDNNWLYYGQASPKQPSSGSTLFRMPLFGGAARKILDHLHVFADLSPDDRRVLVHRFIHTGGMEVISVNAFDGSDEQLIAKSNSSSGFMGTRWSPDGSKLLFFTMEQKADGNYWSLSEMPSQGGPATTILAPTQRRIWFIGWADEGRGIVMTATDPVTKLAQLHYVSYPGGETRRITNDLVGYTTISVGGGTILAGKVERQSKIWLSDWPMADSTRLTIDRDMGDACSWMPDGRVVYDTTDNGKQHLWIGDTNSHQSQQLSPDDAEERQPDVSPDGKLIVFISKRSGSAALWVSDVDGRNARQLTTTVVAPFKPRFTPDGESILFSMDQGPRNVIARISVAGGEPTVVADDLGSNSFFDISPDGRQLAYASNDANHRTRVVVRPLNGGGPSSTFDIDPSYFLRWTPDGKNLAYASVPEDKRRGEALWIQPTNGGPPHQVFDAAPDLIYWAAWSRDGKQVALSHGRFTTDIVLLSRRKTGS